MAVDVTFLPGTNVNNIDTNFERVRTALIEALGREGDLPNHMNADLDMNSNDVLNVKRLDVSELYVDGSPMNRVSWLIGNGPPINTIGIEGDFYIDRLTGDLYGPKTTVWTAPIMSLKGPQGDQGPQGPEGLEGAQGIQGPQGIQGIRGPEGPRGVQGPSGTQGIQGIQGPEGPEGPEGAQGLQGNSFSPDIIAPFNERPNYDDEPTGFSFLDASGGFLYFKLSGDSGDWSTGVQFATGPQGPAGPRGQQGLQGSEGPQGPEGPQGLEGPEGPEGPQGPEGPEGPQGPEGPEGPPGADGEGISDGDKGDVVVSNSGTVWSIKDDAVSQNKTDGTFATITARDVSELLSGVIAGKTLSYTAGSGNLVVVSGQIVQTSSEGFRYEVLASDAVDWYVETAGGVKLRVLSDDPAAWGPAGDGVADDTQIINAASVQNVAAKPTYRTTLAFAPAEVRGNFDLILASPERRHSFVRIEARPLTAPATFGWTPPILPIYENGRWKGHKSARSMFPAVVGQTYYVDPVKGAIGAAGTAADPLLHITDALQKPDVGEVLVAPQPAALATEARGLWGNPAVTTSSPHVIIRPWNIRQGRPVVSRAWEHQESNWTPNGSQPMVYGTSGVSTRPTMLLDLAGGIDGEPVVYGEVISINEAANRPGTWGFSTGGELYVNPINALAPAQSLKVLRTGTCAYWPSNKPLYIDGFDFIGGLHPFEIRNQSGDVILTNCRAIGGLENGFQINTSGTAILENCGTGLNGLDGFNYHKAASYPAGKMVEINCYSIGTTGVGTGSNNQVSTLHDGVIGVRIGGEYSGPSQQIIADVNEGTKAWNVGLNLGNSRNEAGKNTGYELNAADAWFYDCDLGRAARDLLAYNNAEVYLHNTTPASFTLDTGGVISEYRQT